MTDASPPLDTEQPVTDAAALERLHRFGGDKLLREMVALFLQAAPERIAAARTATERGDPAHVELALHSLKASSAQMGAVRMQRLSEEGERLAREGALEGIGTLLCELEQAFVGVREWLTAVRDARPA